MEMPKMSASTLTNENKLEVEQVHKTSQKQDQRERCSTQVTRSLACSLTQVKITSLGENETDIRSFPSLPVRKLCE